MPFEPLLNAAVEAIARDGDLSALQRYLDARLDPNATVNSSGWTLLHLAAEHQRVSFVAPLLRGGAHIDRTDAHGWTPLMVAIDSCMDGHIQTEQDPQWEVPIALLKMGANPYLKSLDQETIFDQALAYGTDLEKQVRALVSSHAPHTH